MATSADGAGADEAKTEEAGGSVVRQLDGWWRRLVTAFAILMSSLASPSLGAVIVFSAYVFGHATGVFMNLPPQLAETAAADMLRAAYYVIPNLSNFDIRAEAANGVPIRAAYVLWAMVYGLLYTVVLLILAALAFEGKDV